MPGEGPEEEREGGPPPDPADRIWVHPSEITPFVTATRPGARPRLRSALIVTGAVAVVVAASLTVALVFRSGRSTDSGRPSSAALRLARAVAASVVTVRVQGSHTTRISGVCIADGLVVTSAHALEGAATIQVLGRGRRAEAARVAGRDPDTDVALLMIPPGTAPAAHLGDGGHLEPGEDVIGVAAGSGSRRWVDVGEVSSLDRYFETADTVVAGLFATNLTAADEHTGGAVLDDHGRVIGVLAVPPSSSTSGLAIPIGTARDVGYQLLLSGQARHAWLGISGTDSAERASGGAQVRSVVPKSPADQAGLQEDDVIVGIDQGTSTSAIGSIGQLMTQIRERHPGDVIDLSLYRNGGKRRVRVELGEHAAAKSP